MLCKHCGSTWNDTYVFDKCPVCGTVFETAKKPFTDAACLISQLIEKYDAEILLDHNRLSAYMMDLLEGNQQGNYSVTLRNPQFQDKVERWTGSEKISEMSIYKKRKRWYAEEKEWW